MLADQYALGVHRPCHVAGPGRSQYENQLAVDQENFANDEATESVSATAADETAQTTAVDGEAANDNAYSAALIGDQGQQALALAQADQTQQLALANARANLTGQAQTGAVADANLQWVKSVAGAENTAANSDATAQNTDAIDDAALEDTFAKSDAVQVDAETKADASAEEAQAQQDVQADALRQNADAAAEVTFNTALFNETANQWAGLNSSVALPWTQYRAGLASAVANWYTTNSGTYTTYVSQQAAAETNYAATDAAEFLTEADGVADDQEAESGQMADAAQTAADAAAGDEATLSHSESEADSTDEVGYAQAGANYLSALWNAYAAQLAAAASAAADPVSAALATYYSNVAKHQSQQIGVDGTDLVTEVTNVTQAEVTLSDETLAASVNETNADDTAQQTETTTLLPEEVQAVENGDAAVVTDVTGDANAQAAYETSVSKDIAQFYQDKATATAGDDQAMAAASVAQAGTMQPDFATYYVELNTNSPTLEDINADGRVASAVFQASYHSDWLTQIGGYGDAEITESKSIGTAQIALATAQGGDEVTLATEEATADQTLTDAIDAQNTTDAETTANDESSTTSTEGSDEEATQQQLANEEVTTAGLLAGDQADYAIATAQYLATAAAGLAQAQPTGANQFASLFAQGYVTWLTNLKTSFVANASAVAQAAANDEVALTTADANLADQEAAANAAEVTTEAPQSASESENIETESDTYQTSVTSNVGQDQISSATADQQQLIALAQAASTSITANAQADKTAQLNYDNNVSGWQAIQIKAIADAKLALTDSQADSDDAWINAKSVADKTFLNSDAGAWQTMTDAEAQTNDTLSHQQDDDAKTEDEAVAGDESTALTAQATADQTQGNADAAGAAAFQIAEGNETSTIWNWLAGQLGNTPWAVSQAGLAGALANWAATAAANYQTYVTSLGTAEAAYAATNSSQFVTEIDGIDNADDTAGNTAADDGLTLADALASDEATFEESLAPAGAGYQQEVAKAQHDDREAIAQADHDLAIGTLTTATYNAAVAAAQNAQTAAYDQAYADFATLVAPAMTLQGDNDANAEQTDSNNDAAANLTDIQTNNAAVDTYDDQESAAYDTQQKADAQALDPMQTADATGQASAISNYDQSNPSPWADLSSAQAAALSAQLTSQANALQTQTDALADAQKTFEQAEADALETKDNADAQAEDNQAVTDAQSAHDEETAKAAATDAVFTYLPYTLIAPKDGPTPVLTPDFQQLYEANDFVLQQYAGYFWQTGQFLGGGNKWTDAPDFMAGVSLLGPAVYDWQGYSSQAPLTPVAAGPSAWTPSSGDVSFASTAVIYGGGAQTYANPAPFALQDILRFKSLPLSAVFGPALHFTGPAGTLLDLSNTPSAVGPGGYAQSPLPTTTAGTQPAAGGGQSSSTSASLMNVSAQAQAKAMQVQGQPAGGNQSGGNTTQQQNNQTPPANETPPADSSASDDVDSADDSTSQAVSATAVILVLVKEPDRAKEPADEKDRPEGEPEQSPANRPAGVLDAADKEAATTADVMPGFMSVQDDASTAASKPAQKGGAAEDAPEKDLGEVLGIPFQDGQGPVIIAGIVGGGVTPPKPEEGGWDPPIELSSGLDKLVDKIAEKIATVDPVVFKKIYGSSDGGKVPFNGRDTLPSKSAQKIAGELYASILENIDKLGNADDLRVLLIGHSWGGDKAVDIVNILGEMLRESDNAKVKELYATNVIQVYLATLDAIGQRANPTARGGNLPSMRELTEKIADWLNLHQGADKAGPPIDGRNLPAMSGSGRNHFPDADDKDVTDSLNKEKGDEKLDRIFYHEAFGRSRVVWNIVLGWLGLPMEEKPEKPLD